MKEISALRRLFLTHKSRWCSFLLSITFLKSVKGPQYCDYKITAFFSLRVKTIFKIGYVDTVVESFYSKGN